MSYFLDFGDFDLSYLVDLHLRVSEDISGDIANARAARVTGMRAVLLRPKTGSTTALATGVAQEVGGLIVMGAYRPGAAQELNAIGFDAVLDAGAKLVDLSHAPLFTPTGELRGEANAILEGVRDRNVILATGELPAEKTILLVKSAQQLGLKKILVPAEHLLNMVQAEMMSENLFFEWTLSGLQYPADPFQIAALADGIRQAGIEACVISTGLEPGGVVEPVDALSHYLAALTAQRLSIRDLKQMAKKTPAFLLDLPERFPKKPDK